VRRTIVSSAIAAFLVTRALVFGAVILGAQFTFLGKTYSSSVWETRIIVTPQRIAPSLGLQTMTGDAWWYRSIAESGYTTSGPWSAASKAAFFPLYPLVVRTARITGDFAIDGAIVSNLAFLGALLLLGFVAARSGLADDEVERAIFFLALFPTSYFCSFPLTESLFLLLVLSAFAAALKRWWWAAGLFGALGALTRVNGVVLLPVLAIAAWELERRWRPQFLWLALIPLGTAAYMFHLQRVLGDPLAFVHAQNAWGRTPGAFWRPLLDYLQHPLAVSQPWNFVVFNFGVALLLFAAGIAFLVRRKWSLAAYTFLSVLLPLSSGSLQSLGRYAMTAFPLFLWLAMVTRNSIAARVVTIVSATLLGWFLALLVLRVDITLA
jgi:hypothetical protein